MALGFQFPEFLRVRLAAGGTGVAVRVELHVRVVQVSLMDTTAPPTAGPRGKVTTGKPHPISVNSTTAEKMYMIKTNNHSVYHCVNTSTKNLNAHCITLVSRI